MTANLTAKSANAPDHSRTINHLFPDVYGNSRTYPNMYERVISNLKTAGAKPRPGSNPGFRTYSDPGPISKVNSCPHWWQKRSWG